MFGEKPRKLITEGVDLKWYFIWSIIGVSSFIGTIQIIFEVGLILLIISIGGFLSLLIIDKNKRSRNNLYIAGKKKILNYLNLNMEKAYTTDALINRVIEKIENPSFKKYMKKKSKEILDKMISNDEIYAVRRKGELHYFIP